MVLKYIPTIQVCLLFCFTVIMVILLSLIPSPVRGEMKTVNHTVKQPFGGSQSPDDARIAAVARAKREALEMAGVYVESFTVVKDSRLEKDEILALTAGVLKAEVVSQKNYHTDDAFGVEVAVRIDVDTSVLEDRVKKLLADRTHLEQLNQARKKEKELLDKMAILEKENQRLMAEKKTSVGLQKQFQETAEGLTAVDWYKMYWVLRKEAIGNYTVARAKADVECLNHVIRLKPDFTEALTDRALTYGWLGQYQKELDDFNEVIRLKPDDASAYGGRAGAYSSLGQYYKAIEDYNNAIRLTLDKDYLGKQISCSGRGSVYIALGQYKNAIKDFSEAIRLMPDFYWNYSYRAQAYNKLGQYKNAIEDCNEAIRLKPDLAFAYNCRGVAYLSMGNTTRGCSDAKKACSLGNCEVYESAKTKGLCH